MLNHYSGSPWESFARALAEYGVAVFRNWIFTGRVFQECVKKGRGRLTIRPRTRDDALELALETVATAISYFREKVLIPKKWDPARGASIKTFFVGACVVAFANVYRRWCREQGLLPRQLAPEEDMISQAPDRRPAADTLLQVAARQADASIKDPTMRQILAMDARDFTYAEIGNALGLTERAVESRVQRFRSSKK